jgi:hypothetical protein
MIRHEGPCATSNIPFRKVNPYSGEKVASVKIIEEDVSFFDPASVYMMHCAREIDPWSSWHTFQTIKQRANRTQVVKRVKSGIWY